MYDVRRATIEDAEFIVSLFSLQHARPFVRLPKVEDIREHLSGEHEDYIVMDGSQRVGLLHCRDLEPGRIYEISQLIALEPNRGIGRAAMQFAINRGFAELKVHRITLEVAEDNAVARHLYESCGFQYEGMFRDGLPLDDGRYKNLCAYGLLESDPR